MSKQSRDDLKHMTELDRLYTNTRSSSTGDSSSCGDGGGVGFSHDADPGPGKEKTERGTAQRSKGRVCSEGRSSNRTGKGGVMPHAYRAVWVRMQVGGPSQDVAVDKFLLHQGDAFLSSDR